MNREWKREDLVVDPDIHISDDGKNLEVYIESWFDVDAKFNTKTRQEDDSWVNLYANYNPKTKFLSMSYVVSSPFGDEEHAYMPTKKERDLVSQLIAEKVSEISGMSPMEYLNLSI